MSIKASYPTIEEMDRVYIYLMDGDKPVCYWKGKVSEFTNANPTERWISLKNDQAIGSVDEEWMAGMI